MRITCAWCEYFDGGGMGMVEIARNVGEKVHGDCHNPGSDRFTTDSDDTCLEFCYDTATKEPAEP